jgi:hypothetical protein
MVVVEDGYVRSGVGARLASVLTGASRGVERLARRGTETRRGTRRVWIPTWMCRVGREQQCCGLRHDVSWEGKTDVRCSLVEEKADEEAADQQMEGALQRPFHQTWVRGPDVAGILL